MGQGRLELPTSRLSGVRSNHLSYWPGWTKPRSLKTESYVTLRLSELLHCTRALLVYVAGYLTLGVPWPKPGRTP